MKTIQDRPPNFRSDGRLFLIRCFACDKIHGTENHVMAVPTGRCVWCGWHEDNGDSQEVTSYAAV